MQILYHMNFNDIAKSPDEILGTPIHMLYDRILVLPDDAETKTKGGIIIPENLQEKPKKGTVLFAGDGSDDRPMTVKGGERVVYGKYAGSELKINGRDVVIMRESDLMFIFPEDAVIDLTM